MKNNILAIDLGTTSCKIAVFNSDMKRIAGYSYSYKTQYPVPGWAQQNPEDWWDAVKKGINSVFSDPDIRKESIAAIGIDSMGSALVAVDKDCKPLFPSLLWMDRRSEDEAEQIQMDAGDLLWKRNGNRSDPSNMAPKILWLKENQSDIYEQTETFLHANGYLVAKLTGVFSIDKTEGGLTQLFDTRQGQWDDELINKLEISKSKLPAFYECHEVVGGVSEIAANETGLCSGIPVVAGAMDMCSAALGSGVYQAGQVYISAGTVTAVGACLDSAVFHKDLHIYPHIIPGLYITAAGVDYGGAGLKWFKEILELENFDVIDKEVACEDEEDFPLIFLPYMVGQRAPLWNSHTTGVIAGLHPAASRADLFRMFMRGNAFGVNRILNILKDENQKIDLVRITGGCANSQPWLKIFADVFDTTIEVPGVSDVAVLGAAAMAAVGCGLKKDYASIFQNREVEQTVVPDEKNVEFMRNLFDIYNNLLEATLPVMESLSNLRYASFNCK